MGRAQAPTIMERKWVRPAVPDRREPGAGPSGRPYFRSSVRPFSRRCSAEPVKRQGRRERPCPKDRGALFAPAIMGDDVQLVGPGPERHAGRVQVEPLVAPWQQDLADWDA